MGGSFCDRSDVALPGMARRCVGGQTCIANAHPRPIRNRRAATDLAALAPTTVNPHSSPPGMTGLPLLAKGLRENPGSALDGRNTMAARHASGQYRFFGGNDRLICLRRRATAAAFLRLRSVVGFS